MEPDYPASLLLWNGLFIAMGAIAALSGRGRIDLRWFVLALALFNIGVALVLDFFGFNDPLYRLAGVDPAAVDWNWAGKLCALTLWLAIAATPLVEREPAGLTLRQAEGWKLGWIVFAILVALNIVVALLIDTPPFDGEAIAYRALMPGLEEELLYRGLLLYALIRTFGEGPRLIGVNFGWAALIASILFGLIHSLFWSGGVVFMAGAFIETFLLGLLMMWLRLRTGSVIAPILLHSALTTTPLVI